MKRLFLALTSALLIVINTSTYAVQPYAFGIKAGFVNSNLTNFLKGKEVNGNEKTQDDKFYNPGVIGSLYGEYAFHDNVGAGLEAGYFFGVADSWKSKEDKKEEKKDEKKEEKKEEKKDDKKETYRNLNFQAVKISPYVAIYPLGREDKEEMGILSININGDVYLPISAKWSGKQDGNDLKDAEKEIKKEKLAAFGLGAGAAVSYEFPFGLIAELKGGYAFTDFWKKEEKKAGDKKDEKKEEKKEESKKGKKSKKTKQRKPRKYE